MNRGLVNIKWCKTVIIRLAQFEPGSGKNLDKTDGAKLLMLAAKSAELTVEMRQYIRTQSKAILAALLIGGLLLAFVASHGCDAKGTSPAGDATAFTHTSDQLTPRFLS